MMLRIARQLCKCNTAQENPAERCQSLTRNWKESNGQNVHSHLRLLGLDARGRHFFRDSTRDEAIGAADDEDDDDGESDRECERGDATVAVVDGGDDGFRAITARGNNAHMDDEESNFKQSRRKAQDQNCTKFCLRKKCPLSPLTVHTYSYSLIHPAGHLSTSNA